MAFDMSVLSKFGDKATQQDIVSYILFYTYLGRCSMVRALTIFHDFI